MFEFNAHKNKVNLKKHGVKLSHAALLWEVDHIIIPAKNLDEERYMILGKYKDEVYACIFTTRDSNIRLISFHRADKKLERYYYEKVN